MVPKLWPLVAWRLSRCLPPGTLDATLGDLLEDYADRRRAVGLVRSELWLLREFMSVTAAYANRDPSQSRRWTSVMDLLASDVWHASRSFRARPASALATTAVLALGIGLVSAMFALADPYVLRPLPYPRSKELVAISLSTRSSKTAVPTLAEWQARTDVFADVAAYGKSRTIRASAGAQDTETDIPVEAVSASFFDILGISAARPADWGRTPTGSETPVVVGPATRRRLFGSQDGIGQLLTCDAEPRCRMRVAAMLPGSFLFPAVHRQQAETGLVPLRDDEPLTQILESPAGRGSYGRALSVIGRLRPRVTPAMAEAALSTGRHSDAAVGSALRVSVVPLTTALSRGVRSLAFGVLAAGVLILLVCAANIANLLLVRGAYRSREFATREALGASRLDVTRLILVELAILTMAGIAMGLVLAHAALSLAAMVIPAQFTALGVPAVTARTVTFACAAGGLVMAAGLVPAWAARRVASLPLFSEIAAIDTRRMRGLRFAVTAAQTAVASILLVAAALLGRSYFKLIAQDSGLAGDTFAVQVTYPFGLSGQALQADVEATLQRVQALPNIVSAAAARAPMADGSTLVGGGSVVINGRRVPAAVRQVTADFFAATGSQLVTGRLPRATEARRAAVVNESFAKACCAAASPVGLVTRPERPVEIVGVIRDMYDIALDQRPEPSVFFPMDDLEAHGAVSINYLFRVARPDALISAAVERAAKSVNPRVTFGDSRTLRERLMRSVTDRSFATLVVAFFAAAAIGVSASGLTGVIGFVVARRTREIAIRRALGATGADVRRLVMREATMAAGLGSVLGLLAGGWLSKALQTLLYGIEPGDAGSIGTAALLMLAVVAVSSWVPARRASQLSATAALRVE